MRPPLSTFPSVPTRLHRDSRGREEVRVTSTPASVSGAETSGSPSTCAPAPCPRINDWRHALVAGARDRCPRAAAVGRDLRPTRQPQSPRPVGRLTHPNPWARHRALRVVECQPHRTVWVKQIKPVVRHSNSQGRAQISRTTSQCDGTDRLAAPGRCDTNAVLESTGPDQDGGGRSVGSARDIGADMDAVAAVGVEPPRGPEHHDVTSAETAIRVRGGIWPGTVGNPAVRLHLDDDGAHAASGEAGAEHTMRGRDRVNRQLFRVHRTDSAPPGVERAERTPVSDASATTNPGCQTTNSGCALDTAPSGDEYSSYDDFITR